MERKSTLHSSLHYSNTQLPSWWCTRARTNPYTRTYFACASHCCFMLIWNKDTVSKQYSHNKEILVRLKLRCLLCCCGVLLCCVGLELQYLQRTMFYYKHKWNGHKSPSSPSSHKKLNGPFFAYFL